MTTIEKVGLIIAVVWTGLLVSGKLQNTPTPLQVMRLIVVFAASALFIWGDRIDLD